MAGNAGGPAGPEPAGRVLPSLAAAPGPAARRPVEPGADRGQQHRQQGQGGHGRRQRDEQAGVADAAQERHREQDQGQQADGNGAAAGHHRPAGGGHGPVDGLLAVVAPAQLLPPAGHDQQRVVDGHPEADQGDQELDDEADLDQPGQAEDGQEGGQDGHGGDQQRHQGQEAAEHEGQHDQGAEGPGQGLDQDPGAGRLLGRGRAQRVQAGHLDGRARREGSSQPVGERLGQGRVAAVGALVRAPDEPVDGPAVLHHQAAVAGGGRPGQHPQPRVGGDPGEGPVEGVPGPGAVDGGPLGQLNHRDQRVAGPAVAVGLQDGHVGLVALLAGEGELLGQPPRHHPGRGHPGDQDHQPGRDHGQLVAEQELGQSRHGSPPGGWWDWPPDRPARTPGRSSVTERLCACASGAGPAARLRRRAYLSRRGRG